ncbi:hypothetical protein [Demequina aestuarii]|uniref:hypothetical protein n=1 Tax=Demequina aestuarii TaxID=327095 RepID=UPI00128D9BE1|nr:hypothetical protein [Demequina aestuarii]
MDELQRMLVSEREAVRASLPSTGPELVARVRRSARRRRQVRALATGAAAVLAIGAIGVGAYGLTTTNRAEPALPNLSSSPESSVPYNPSPEPSISPSPMTPTEPSADPRFDDSPDGIADDAYPALAADRGAIVPGDADREATMYPRAHVMEDWVWEAVGEGWALDVVSVTWNIGHFENPLPPAVLYLVSPEDVHFELRELPERMWASPRVTSWREQQGTASMWWRNVDGDEHTGRGAVVDLRTGDVDDLVMAVYGETAHDYSFVMSNAAGDELWRAESDAGFKYYRWRDGADDDGWVATALVDQEPTADDFVEDPKFVGFTTTADGNRVLLQRAVDSAAGEASRDGKSFLVYDLDADHISETVVRELGRDASVYSAAFEGADTVMVGIGYREETGKRGFQARITLGGSGALSRVDDDEPWAGHPADAARYDLYFGKPAPQGANGEACGC